MAYIISIKACVMSVLFLLPLSVTHCIIRLTLLHLLPSSFCAINIATFPQHCFLVHHIIQLILLAITFGSVVMLLFAALAHKLLWRLFLIKQNKLIVSRLAAYAWCFLFRVCVLLGVYFQVFCLLVRSLIKRTKANIWFLVRLYHWTNATEYFVYA